MQGTIFAQGRAQVKSELHTRGHSYGDKRGATGDDEAGSGDWLALILWGALGLRLTLSRAPHASNGRPPECNAQGDSE